MEGAVVEELLLGVAELAELLLGEAVEDVGERVLELLLPGQRVLTLLLQPQCPSDVNGRTEV